MFPPITSSDAHDERRSLMLAFAETVYERGYAQTRLSDVARWAGVDPATVHRYWRSEEACAFETLDVATERAFSATAEAFTSATGDCPEAAHRALAGLVTHLAGVPALVHLAVIELPGLGPQAHARMQGYLELFSEFLGPGFAAMGHPVPRPELVATMISGGIYEVIRQHAVQRRIAELPAALPAISYVCVGTFFGTAEAERIAALPTPDLTPRGTWAA
jgi:AcrR family transcriptional regulator